MDVLSLESKKHILLPDYMLADVYEINPELLQKYDVSGLVLDIDDTLVPHNVASPCRRLVEHLRALSDAGIKIAFVSNNKRGRVKRFNRKFRFFAVWNSGKPFGSGIRKSVEHMELEHGHILLVGDQIFTDCLGAHLCGIRCAIVPPIEQRNTLFFRFKRFIEKPVIRYFKRFARSE